MDDLGGLIANLFELFLDVLSLLFEDTLDIFKELLRLRLFVVFVFSILLLFLEALELFLLLLDCLFSSELLLKLLLQIFKIVRDDWLVILLDSVGPLSANLGRN